MSYAKSWEIKALPISTDRHIYYVKKTDATNIITKANYDVLDNDNKALYELKEPLLWDGRSLTEVNLSNFVKCLLDPETAKGFIVSVQSSESNYTQINFVLGGYYFELTDTTLLQNSNTYLSVKLNYNTSAADDPYKYLYGDSGSDYEGLVFYTDKTTSGDLILIKDGVIPTSSYFKFKTRSIENICGGTI